MEYFSRRLWDVIGTNFNFQTVSNIHPGISLSVHTVILLCAQKKKRMRKKAMKFLLPKAYVYDRKMYSTYLLWEVARKFYFYFVDNVHEIENLYFNYMILSWSLSLSWWTQSAIHLKCHKDFSWRFYDQMFLFHSVSRPFWLRDDFKKLFCFYDFIENKVKMEK